jgi:hypothetical protein
MDRKIMAPILLVLALVALIYAVYRSVGETIIINDATRQTIYGNPQHGLVLGLCIFAGICLAAAVSCMPRRRELRREETVHRRIP